MGSSSEMLPRGFSSEAVGLSAWLAGLCCAPEAVGDKVSSSATEGSACGRHCQRLCFGLEPYNALHQYARFSNCHVTGCLALDLNAQHVT